jgi:hypothetical protein
MTLSGATSAAELPAQSVANMPGSDDDDFDPPRGDLLREGLGQTFDGELGGAVPAQGRKRPDADDGGEVEDRAGATSPHTGQYGIGDRSQPVHVDLKHCADSDIIALLDRCEVTDAGVAE